MKIYLYCITAILFISCQTKKSDSQLLLNHLGYHSDGLKNVVLQTNSEFEPTNFKLFNSSNSLIFEGNFEKGGQVDSWHTGNSFSGDFSNIKEQGKYYITTLIGKETVRSREFDIYFDNEIGQKINLLLDGFISQHTSGDFNSKDSKMTFFGDRKDTVDVKGGWYDASGDRGKYLSHLCYSNFFNPQQTPMIVWNLMETINQYEIKNSQANEDLLTKLENETTYGSDFLVRMQDKEGYFYINVFANWSWDPNKREICAYETQDGIKTDKYKAGFREGGGISIAALARAASKGLKGEFSNEKYLEAAKKGFSHLLENNSKYIDDGIENIIDDYCALLASTELYIATEDESYLNHARLRMTNLSNRLSSDDNYSGWWLSDEKNRPFFHGTEAGLPLIAISRYLEIEKKPEQIEIAVNSIRKSVDFEIDITNEVHNPFGYPRQYVKATNEKKSRASFFVPHNNETGYWWQGENSRITSLVTAFRMVEKYLNKEQINETNKINANCINWIFGLNPYDVSMFEGYGHNNPEYLEPENLNFRGGVCNGITAGFTNETDIAFMPQPQNEDPAQRWRWSEQWMPHGSWLMLALATQN